MTHYCGHLSAILLNSPCENKNQCLESLAEFLWGNKTKLCFTCKFSKAAILIQENETFSRTFENIKPLNTLYATEVKAKNDCVTIIKRKCCKKIILLLI